MGLGKLREKPANWSGKPWIYCEEGHTVYYEETEPPGKHFQKDGWIAGWVCEDHLKNPSISEVWNFYEDHLMGNNVGRGTRAILKEIFAIRDELYERLQECNSGIN